MPISVRQFHLVNVTVAVAVILAACGSDSAQSESAVTTVTTTDVTASTTDVVVTQAPSSDPSPTVDSTAAGLVYQASGGGGDAIFVAIADGSDPQPVGDDVPGSHKHPDWSPDGMSVVFVAEASPSTLWQVGLDGSPSQEVYSCDCFDLDNPAWSPDGKRVAFTRYEPPAGDGPPAASSIVVLDLAAGTTTDVTTSEAGQLVDVPRWSPDGDFLVFGIDRFDDSGNETGSTIAVVPSVGGAVTPLVDFESFAYYPDWNHATDTIVFSTETLQYAATGEPSTTWDLFEILPDGTGRRTITTVPDDVRLWQPSWTPDGQAVVATQDADGERTAVLIDPESGAVTPLTSGLATHTRLRPGGN